MLSGREPRDSGFLPSSKDTQQHSWTESSAAAPADNKKPGEAATKREWRELKIHKEREDTDSENGGGMG